ncbi:PepSY domain-containing protein [Sphingobium ummariense]|uniref:Nitric oxide synthase n=1 Tax=Sphingobium ummariense RL-3 TaxID=1346791 RepID=T0ITN7_9SPHN|nr:sulfite reductase flavoprotein subunit alpha [Sphingobium ummariense]EQB32180.1 hypothetical protein M529_10280 [Sphingobium ummariense RL-3]
MTKRVIFQAHWFLGITAGLVLAVMDVTGATMSFEDEIMEALSPSLFFRGVPATPDLSPDALVARVEAQHPGYRFRRIEWEMARDRSHGVRLVKRQGKAVRLDGRVDRATGEWLGEPRGASFFATVEDLHRWLALPGGGSGIGRQITGFAALALIFFSLSGLYLRWPRRAGDWREWLVLDLRKSGRNMWRALHAIVGTWVLAAYLLSATTGLWWSYDWYRRAATYTLTGKAVGKDGDEAPAKAKKSASVSLDRAWANFRKETRDRYAWVAISAPSPGKPVLNLQALPKDARHERQWDRFSYNTRTGERTRRDLYDTRSIGTIVSQSMVEVHRGAFLGIGGRIIIFVSSMTMPLFAITGYLLYLSRRRRQRQARRLAKELKPAGPNDLVIAFASQTGTAELKARDAAIAFADGGASARVVQLHALTPELLAATRRLLLVVSTYGEGEPPDMAKDFARRMLASIDLSHLEFGLLALGDREYRAFCAFGRKVDQWLISCGARPMRDAILIDRNDPLADREWQALLASLGAHEPARAVTPEMSDWTLVQRTTLNPGSAHAPVYHLKLKPPHDDIRWQAGDLAEVQPKLLEEGTGAAVASDQLAKQAFVDAARRDGGRGVAVMASLPHSILPPREYSIASIVEDGTVDLVVRQVRRPDGNLGIGSGWLTAGIKVGGTVAMRVRPNPEFRVEANGAPLILIGNGTGIAGLRSHLRAQAHAGCKGHWLMFGERERAHDAFFDSELQMWLQDETLARLDRAFSRDVECGRYVQHLLAGARSSLDDWFARGATILVCGSLDGMAAGVHSALAEMLGEEILSELAEAGRYRRDVY